jgi:spore coat polysaccharide biosynthesis protein SpsF
MSNNRIGIIIQARMGSSRLPGKILMPIGKKTLLEHILYRLDRLRHNATTVIATSNISRDDVVADFCAARAVACFRGSEDNVLDRYYRCTEQYRFYQIIRMTADNPFTDIGELDRLIDLHLSRHSDYAHSFDDLPMGAGAEIFTFDALARCWRDGHAPHHLEHVNEYLLEHPELFRTETLRVAAEKRRPDIRLTVDTADDYRRACYIVEHSTAEYVSIPQVIRLAEAFAAEAGGTC